MKSMKSSHGTVNVDEMVEALQRTIAYKNSDGFVRRIPNEHIETEEELVQFCNGHGETSSSNPKVKEWLQNLGIGEHTAMVQDDDEGDDEYVSLHTEQTHESGKDRDVPSSAALPIIRPTLGIQHSIADRAKRPMQGYLNHFLENISIVNSREVTCGIKSIKIRVKRLGCCNDVGLRPPKG
ncbi:hypothetical protein JHK87_039805 [Glycine soja]|nr:hypothetical protein JHK87_039805 [Glycine soja]